MLRTGVRCGVLAAVAFVVVSLLVPAAAPAVAAPHSAARPRSAVPPPVATGTLRIVGRLQDGAPVQANGLSWAPGKLPPGDRLLSFEVGYYWFSCPPASNRCRIAADSTATPFAASSYIVGHADTGRTLKVEEVATEVVETNPATFRQGPVSSSSSVTTSAVVAPFPRRQAPRTEFVNGTPEATTGSQEEYFSVDPPHFNAADGVPLLQYRVNGGAWTKMPQSNVFYTGGLHLGRQRVEVRVADAARSSVIAFGWRVVPLPAPVTCVPRSSGTCWYPPHLNGLGRPMRWDWQIGVVTPVQRTGSAAVDLYDVDGWLTTTAEVRAMHTTWQAATLARPKVACYLDAAWENYRPDASPVGYGGRFPPDTLGKIYYGYPDERWLDFRQLDALKPMLEARIRMCAEKGFDAVEIDDIDSFDPPGTTGFHLTPGDAQNFLAYTFNLIHRYGMTALWKNSPLLSSWGRRYTDGAVVEECYVGHGCVASQLAGQSNYGITCTALSGPTPCGWDDFTTDVSARQPNGKWVGEAEYLQDHYVCKPGVSCAGKPHRKSFSAFCHSVYSPPAGFSAVLFTVDLNATVFYPCPSGV